MPKARVPKMRTTPIAESGNQGGIGMWPSEESASRIYDLANSGLIIGLVIGVISTALIIWMGKVKEAHLRKYVADTNVRAADAEQRAAEAKITATEAGAGTAKALTEQERLRHENLALSIKLEDERLARIKIEESVAWRRLTKDQQSEIGTRLRPFSGQVALLQYNVNDLEASAFGSDIASALELAGWGASEPLAIVRLREGPVPLGTNPPLETGVVIVSTGDEASRAASDAILHELIARGFDATRSPRNESRPNSVVFISLEHRPEGAQGEAKLRAKNRPIQ